MSTANVFDLDQNTFKSEVLDSDKPVLVDFWAEWCAPCKRMSPILEEIANEYPGYKITKVDVEANQQLASEYGIMSIPAMYIFKGGEVKEQIIGTRPKEVLVAALEKVA